MLITPLTVLVIKHSDKITRVNKYKNVMLIFIYTVCTHTMYDRYTFGSKKSLSELRFQILKQTENNMLFVSIDISTLYFYQSIFLRERIL